MEAKRAPASLIAAVAAVLTGCSTGHHAVARTNPAFHGSVGSGADRVWVFRPRTQPRSVVVFIHGLGLGELSPANHQAWIEHLVSEGSAVLYPRYEQRLGSGGAVLHILAGVKAGVARLGRPHVPLVAIGYSRGGELVADYAAIAAAARQPVAAVLTVFPAGQDPADPPLDLRGIDRRTPFVMLIGDRDAVVDGSGAHRLLLRLEAAGFPPDRISIRVVHSHGTFVATHAAPLEVSAAAKAAFWTPADRLIASVRAPSAIE